MRGDLCGSADSLGLGFLVLEANGFEVSLFVD